MARTPQVDALPGMTPLGFKPKRKAIVKEALGAVDTWYVLKDDENGMVLWQEETKAAATRAMRRYIETGSFS